VPAAVDMHDGSMIALGPLRWSGEASSDRKRKALTPVVERTMIFDEPLPGWSPRTPPKVNAAIAEDLYPRHHPESRKR